MTLDGMLEARQQLKQDGRALVFTNGCFDILHTGHTQYLSFARNQGDALVVGLNSDASVQKAKGPNRPVNSQDDRAQVLASLESVDYVVIFDDDEPINIITAILPDVLVKGEDWAHYVSGREVVEENGGKVVLAPLVEGKSTTDTINRMKDS
jgi:rfaE bifunctional protein nucleotidyltransferase chain/domain